MKLALAASFAVLLVPLALAATTARGQGTKWQPFRFQGNERYEYTLISDDGSGRKETGFALDIRKKDADFDVTWSIRSTLKPEELNEQTLLVGFANVAPAWAIMNPMYALFVNELELEEGEKMSVFGAGTVKVTGKETVGGRTGYTCQFFQKSGEEEVLTWEWTVDPELALPIKSITHDGARETSRAELKAYQRE